LGEVSEVQTDNSSFSSDNGGEIPYSCIGMAEKPVYVPFETRRGD
jgi:hypothetical protein